MEYKIIGINTRSMPSQFSQFADYAVVLVEGDIGDYAAYYGQGN